MRLNRLSRSTASAVRNAARPVFADELEPRRHLTVTLSVVNNELKIVGDNAANSIYIIRNKSKPTRQYTIVGDGVETVVNINAFERFRIATLGGNDTITIDAARGLILQSRFVDLAAGNDTYLGVYGRDVVSAGDGNDFVGTGNSNDELYGNAGNDTLAAGAERDYIEGGDGNDSCVGAAGNDTVLGGYGDDQVFGNAGNDLLFGETTNVDTSSGNDDDLVVGDDGDDTVWAGPGKDTVTGGLGNDRLYGDAGNDIVAGESGDDVVGGDSEDRNFGRTENVIVTTGLDTLTGADGNDTILGQFGQDLVDGGANTNIVDIRGNDDTNFSVNNNDIIPVEQVYTGTAATNVDFSIILVAGGRTLKIQDAGLVAAGGTTGGVSTARVLSVSAGGTATVRFSDLAVRGFRLAEFFQQLGVSFDGTHLGRNYGAVTMNVNGSANTSFQNYTVQNGDAIQITVAG